VIARLLQKFADWALSKNAPGGYGGEDDKRWAYTIETDGDPYLTRVILSRLLKLRDRFGVGVFLHKFHRHDIDRHLHNHPWKWAFSIILSGSYTEERLEAYLPMIGMVSNTQRVRWFNYLTDADYHAVKQLHGDVWTLFITGPRIQDWGFLVDGKHVPWKKYLGKQ
jgi:hypothetical protein